MNCLTLADTLERAAFDTGYNSKAFQTPAAVQTPAESPHFSDCGAGFEEQGLIGLNTNEGSFSPLSLATRVQHRVFARQRKLRYNYSFPRLGSPLQP